MSHLHELNAAMWADDHDPRIQWEKHDRVARHYPMERTRQFLFSPAIGEHAVTVRIPELEAENARLRAENAELRSRIASLAEDPGPVDW